MNNPDAIQAAFENYYQTTILADETDPDKLHDLRGTLDQRQVYSWEQVDAFVEAYLNGANRGQLDPALDVCVEEYLTAGRGRAGGVQEFGQGVHQALRLPVPGTALRQRQRWEKLSIFLNFLIRRSSPPQWSRTSPGECWKLWIWTATGWSGRRPMSISLAEEDAEINPVLPGAGGGTHEPEMDRLSNIIAEFNKTWGGTFSDSKRVEEVLSRMPGQVLEDQQYQNARKNSGRQNAQVELDSALRRLVTSMVRCQTELYKAYTEDEEFREWLNGEMFRATYQDQGKE